MKKIKKLNFEIKLVRTGIFHDSREDVRRIGNAMQKLADKVDELVDEINEINELKNS